MHGERDMIRRLDAFRRVVWPVRGPDCGRRPRLFVLWLAILLSGGFGNSVTGQVIAPVPQTPPETKSSVDAGLMPFLISEGREWISAEASASSLRLLIPMLVLGLIPALLLMTTAYVRIAIVLSLLRQALGAPQALPAQVTTSLALISTVLVMWPTWQSVYDETIGSSAEVQSARTFEQQWQAGIQPIRQFMSRQIEATGNSDDVWLFLRHLPEVKTAPTTYDEVPLRALLPAYMLSELKTAFLIGFQIYLPFLVIDLVVATVTTAMGMFMLPPTMISMPLKLLLFVLVDGWHLLIGMLLESFQVAT
jgi:flagellar biosynthetic protein FliP